MSKREIIHCLIRTNKTIVIPETRMSNKELVKICKAIGNERRLLILKHLFSKKTLTVGQISELIHLSFKSVSRHLSVLSNANLVEIRKINLNHIYSINTKSAKDFIKFFQG